jgi:DNA-binding CsgD family transcriptional regulator
VSLISKGLAAGPVLNSWTDQITANVMLRFMDWGQGLLPIEQVLPHAVSCFGAVSGSFTRIRLRTMGIRVLAISAESDIDVEAHTSLVAPFIGEDVDKLKIGLPVLMSNLEVSKADRYPDADTWKMRNRIRDVGFICLSRNSREADYLELYFRENPGTGWEGAVGSSAAVLARVYEVRRPGLVTEALARDRARSERHLPDDFLILAAENVARLTRTEWKVCVLVSRGLVAKSVAAEIGVSTTTVRTHLRNIYAKTGFQGYHQLAHRLVSPEEQQALHDPGRMIA